MFCGNTITSYQDATFDTDTAIFAVLIAVVDWGAVGRGRRVAEYIGKPTVMLALLAWLAGNGWLRLTMAWFGLGLALSLV